VAPETAAQQTPTAPETAARPTPAAGQDAQRIEELRRQIEELRQQHAEEIEDLRADLEGLEQELAETQARSREGNVQRDNVFNPAITVFGNFLARDDSDPVYVDDDPTQPEIGSQFLLREAEVDFRAAIDPWADGVLIASISSEEPDQFDTSIEEGYCVLKKLPLFDTAPAGLKLKVGRFRTDFGRFNVIHLHDLPQPTYPRSLGTFLGPEGMSQDGVGAQFFLPSWSDSQTLEASLQVVDGGGAPVDEDVPSSDITDIGHLAWFADLGRGNTLSVGTSAMLTDADHRLYGADLTYKWKPYEGGEWHSFLVGGELFQADLNDPPLADSPQGFYLWTQYQFDKNLYLGVRYDQTEELDDESLVTQTLGTYLTYYTTEFLRFRLGVEHTESDLDYLDGVNSLLLEVNTVFGSHPVEPYWVNR
jgi:hypothetical protein